MTTALVKRDERIHNLLTVGVRKSWMRASRPLVMEYTKRGMFTHALIHRLHLDAYYKVIQDEAATFS